MEILPFGANVVLLLIAAGLCYSDISIFNDGCMPVYLAKTFGGDYFAGKLDTREWYLVLAFVFAIFVPVAAWMAPPGYINEYGRVALILFVVQLLCELGDQHLEHWAFWRHRYSFEILSISLFAIPNLTPLEQKTIQFDLVTCLAYRLGNALIICVKSNLIGIYCQGCAFRCFGWRHGLNVVVVDDPIVAQRVLKASSAKGFALERHLATPAWAPILSLESVDGELYQSMRSNLGLLMARLPPIGRLTRVSSSHVTRLLDQPGRVIDADAIAQLTISMFVEYVFNRSWEDSFQVLVDSSWEWRKEIAIRGRADSVIKARAIAVVVDDLLLNSSLWPLFGERWREPAFYSLIMQPFLLSPCISIGDIMVAIQMQPSLSIDSAIRMMHPFPILERWLEQPLILDGREVIPARTQVIMFTSAFLEHSFEWNIFGAGPRACVGANFAAPLLRMLAERLPLAGMRYQPERRHRFSGIDTYFKIVHFVTD